LNAGEHTYTNMCLIFGREKVSLVYWYAKTELE